jgi:hypothetical protein
MKKALFIISHIFLANIAFAQNQVPLTVREAYNFAVGDTFQYFDYNLSINPYARNYKQVTILNKAIDSLNQQYVYTQQIERFTPAYTAGNYFVSANYTKSTELFRTRPFDSSTYTKPLCQPVMNPSRTNYCYDSLTTDYGNRKTWKHEFNNNSFQLGKTHYAVGLGLTLDTQSSEQQQTGSSSKMTFYNKNGQVWGERTDVFDIQKAMCPPLTMREVYDFAEGDIFIYKKEAYRYTPFPGRFDTLYERQTVLKKSLFLPDSMVYILKNESVYASALSQLMLRTDTFVVKNLDSSVVFAIKGNVQAYLYVQDVCNTFSNTNRKVYGRSLYSDRIYDIGYSYYYGRGIGLTFYSNPGPTPDSKALIYFKKGIEIWGTPFTFPTAIATPSVFNPQLRCFPNPTGDVLNIETDISVFDIKISNLSGQIVLKSENRTAINIRNLPNGLYFLHVFEGAILRGVNKFIVQH